MRSDQPSCGVKRCHEAFLGLTSSFFIIVSWVTLRGECSWNPLVVIMIISLSMVSSVLEPDNQTESILR